MPTRLLLPALGRTPLRFLRGMVVMTVVVVLARPAAAKAQASTGGSAPPRAVGDTSVFAPLLLPTPNEYRSGSGAPGPGYWQNRADYALSATLDTAAKTVKGQLTLRYTNRSPDTLRFMWLQVEQNAFKSNSLNSFIFPDESRFGARGFEGGYTFARLDQLVASSKGGTPRRVKLNSRLNETMMKVDFAEPLAPGRTAVLDMAWSFVVPEHGADRMGRDGALYEIAQWFPRAAVYDDVRGWNIEPYLGQGEFYLDYGDYALAITVPSGYVVAATGALQNAREVLPAAQIARHTLAAKSDTVIRIITADDLTKGTARLRTSGTQTWRFVAKNVRDAVWAASPDFQWDASSWKGIMAYAYYRPEAAVNWHDAADQSRQSIIEYSERWFMYPWPHISAVEGPVSGMEYPMIAMESIGNDIYDLFNVVTHEIGHMWFPMIVGSNERISMWQDEGFTTFINTFAEGRRYPERGDQMARAAEERRMVEQYMAQGFDKPVDINPDRINPGLLGEAAYVKPSVGLQLLRQEILGPEAFDDAFRSYIARWAYKHPTPADFYRTMEDVGGRRLDWFWRQWFVENARFDQSVDSVRTRTRGDTTFVAVLYGNRERGVLPIRARFTFDDGTSQEFVYPAEVWSTNSRRYAREYAFANKQLVHIELDPDQRLVDVNRQNNRWGTKRAMP